MTLQTELLARGIGSIQINSIALFNLLSLESMTEQKANCGTTRAGSQVSERWCSQEYHHSNSIFYSNSIYNTENISTGVLASFLPPPSLNKRYSRNKVLGYNCTYFNLEEK